MAPNGPNAQIDRSDPALPEDHGRSKLGGSSDFDSYVVAFRQAYRENYADLLRYANSRVGSTEVAQDIVQQGFTNTLMSLERGADIRNIGGFVQRCVHNLCVNHTLREPQVSLHGEILGMNDSSTAASAEHRVRWGELERVLSRLVPSQRDVFVLAEIRGCSYEEIAQTTDRSVDSVRQLLYRARRIVRTKGDTDTGWAVGPLPVFGLDQVFDANCSGNAFKIGGWVREKASDFHTWLASICQGSTDALLQPGVSVVTGAVVVALATVSPGPLTEVDSNSEEAGPSVTQRSKHSASRPITSTAIANTVDVGQPVVSRLPLGNVRNGADEIDRNRREAPAKKRDREEPESIIASDSDDPESSTPSASLGQTENPGGSGQPEGECGLERAQEPCDKESPEVSIPSTGDNSTGNQGGGVPPEDPLGEEQVENSDQPLPEVENNQEDALDNLDPQMEQKGEASASL